MPLRLPRTSRGPVACALAPVVPEREVDERRSLPPVHVRLDLVDPVPAHELLEGQDVVEARTAIGARRAPDAPAGHVLLLPLSVGLLLPAAPARHPERRLGVEGVEQDSK